MGRPRGVREVGGGAGDAGLLVGAEGVRAAALRGLLGPAGGAAAAPLAAKMAAPRRCRVLVGGEEEAGAGPSGGGGGGVAGYIVVERRGTGGHVCELAVREASRGRGWGRALLLAGLELLEGTSPRPLFVSLRVDPERSPAARGLYESVGFVLDSRQSDYYGPGRDALYMIRDPGEA